ncbi:MAG: YlcG family protein [Pantoea sp. Morm]|jgi:hypothetical protein|uniref:YlcG family protein n=1 Tax=Candidatus Pantoea communis TaxID=2608354 RepID=A0ABX0RXT1_9GAMM|nr:MULTISPECIES: YlcG family protein [Enterobacterales]KGT86783.1 hypothetical protein NH00_24680 [Enterobacter cancerogenus]MBK4772031.1 YlcG family protein [Pantoea sp. Morm]NIG22377.1 YlcG family protein [Pantoea communis]
MTWLTRLLSRVYPYQPIQILSKRPQLPGKPYKNHQTEKEMIADYLREKWRLLRMYRSRNTFPVDYRIIKHIAKIMGMKHAH